MTVQDWVDLERRYREVFGENIPRTMLPADQRAAAESVRKAIAARDASIIERGIPGRAEPLASGVPVATYTSQSVGCDVQSE